jgi:hypothetical protein
MTSYFDQLLHPFKCPAAQCGQIFKQTYRSLLHENEVICPKCAASIDIRKSKRAGEIGSWINTVTELDKKIDKKK